MSTNAPQQTTSRTDSQGDPPLPHHEKVLVRFVAIIALLGLSYLAFSFGRPLYWRFYATVLKPFEDDPISPFDDPLIATAAARLYAEQLKKERTGVKLPSATPAANKSVEIVAAVPVLDKAKTVKPVAEKPVARVNVETEKQPQITAQKHDPANYELTKDKVKSLAQDGYLMVTWANHHYFDFAKSWVFQVKKVGVHGYIVGAMDDEILKALLDAGTNTWRMNTGLTKNDLGWGSPNFHKMGRWKIKLIKQFLDLDVIVIISDIDTAWIKNPIPYFQRYKEADILTSTDQLGPTVKDDSLERWPDAGSSFNIGIMVFQKNSTKFVDEWIKLLESSNIWDQSAFNDLVRKGAQHSGPNGLFKGYEGTLTVGILPSSIFCSGHTFFVQRKYQEYGLEPYVAHATFQYSGTPGKRHRFREALLWVDPPEYFDDPKGFITFKLDIPEEMLKKAAPKDDQKMDSVDIISGHFELIHYQLSQIRNALAIATITGRVVVLPEMQSGMDKYWAPLYAGRIPGSHFKLPFVPPMDHIFDLEGGWSQKMPEEHYGPDIKFREYSFLKNPRLPDERKQNKVVVEICPSGATDCNRGDAPAKVQDGKIKLAQDLTSEQIKVALSEVSNAKFLEFTTMKGAFKNFTQEQDFVKFFRRTQRYTASFCCLESHPGWYWYDFWYDIPHTDRFGRTFTKWEWKKGDQRRLQARKLQAMTSFSEETCSVEFAPNPWDNC